MLMYANTGSPALNLVILLPTFFNDAGDVATQNDGKARFPSLRTFPTGSSHLQIDACRDHTNENLILFGSGRGTSSYLKPPGRHTHELP